MKKWMLFILIGYSILNFIRCSKTSTNPEKDPPAYSLNGTWYILITVTGGDKLPEGTQYSADVVLQQNENGAFSGTIDAGDKMTANISGQVSGIQFTFTIKQNLPCSGTFTGSGEFTENGRKISGSFSGNDCNGRLSADVISTDHYTRIITSQPEGDITDIWEGRVSLKTDYFIEQGDSLIIKPGTTVLADDYSGIWCRGGTLIAKGTSDQIIIFKDASPTLEKPWSGIKISGGTAVLEYCSIQDANDGIFIYSDDGVINISHCLLYNNRDGIVNFGSNLEFHNCSFIGNEGNGYSRWERDHDDYFYLCHFEDHKYSDITIHGSAATVNVTIQVCQSNFMDSYDRLTDIFKSLLGEVINSQIIIDQSYGFTDGQTNIETNRVEVTRSVNEPISHAGCGFESQIIAGKTQAKSNIKISEQEKLFYRQQILTSIRTN
ncbi:right-handed parallel beta-helix repeat-containing protein [candidate division KSB1 bacterium]|nr:right-handed parallel beta-helix repeat-containing protein [candidate division KSB1 bacterium]